MKKSTLRVFNRDLKFYNQELEKAAILAVQMGYKVHTFNPSGNTIKQIFIDNGKTFGSISEFYSGVSYSTCHKSETGSGNGTGFGLTSEPMNAEKELINSVFTFAPNWATNTHMIKKQTWEESQAEPLSKILKYADISVRIADNASELKYIVNTKDFRGYIETTFRHWEGKSLDKCYTDYSNKPVSDYIDSKALQGIDLEILTEEQIDQLLDKHYQSLQGDWKEITEDQYFEALEVLPPQNWHSLSSKFSMFYCMEAFTGSLHSFYIEDKVNKKFYSALRDKYVKDSILLLQLDKIK